MGAVFLFPPDYCCYERSSGGWINAGCGHDCQIPAAGKFQEYTQRIDQ